MMLDVTETWVKVQYSKILNLEIQILNLQYAYKVLKYSSLNGKLSLKN